jgi:hypothetical protein
LVPYSCQRLSWLALFTLSIGWQRRKNNGV